MASSNLQTIIDGAHSGDKIVVYGVCVGNFSIPGGGSAASLTIVGRAGATLDGNHYGTVVDVGPSETVTFTGLLITNGDADIGGGIYNRGVVNLGRNARVNGNHAATSGGGIYNDGGAVNLRCNAQVNGNSATQGGGYSPTGTAPFTSATAPR